MDKKDFGSVVFLALSTNFLLIIPGLMALFSFIDIPITIWNLFKGFLVYLLIRSIFTNIC